MARQKVCDLCKRPCNEIKKKIFIAPIRTRPSDYTHSLDVGDCCANKIMEIFPWAARRRKEKVA